MGGEDFVELWFVEDCSILGGAGEVFERGGQFFTHLFFVVVDETAVVQITFIVAVNPSRVVIDKDGVRPRLCSRAWLAGSTTLRLVEASYPLRIVRVHRRCLF